MLLLKANRFEGDLYKAFPLWPSTGYFGRSGRKLYALALENKRKYIWTVRVSCPLVCPETWGAEYV